MVPQNSAFGQAPPVACKLEPGEQQVRHREVTEQLFAYASEPKEIEDGYQYRFPGDREIAERLSDYILFERQCCPFFTFEVMYKPDEGPITLRLRGPEGTKAFLEEGMMGESR